MDGFKEKIAELKRLEAETLAEAKAEVGAIVAEVRGKNPSTLVVMNFSDIEDSDWSAERYVPSAQARALESALDRPTTAGIISAVKRILSEKRVTRSTSGWPGSTINHKVNLSRRTMGIVEKSSIGKYAASVAKTAGAAPHNEGAEEETNMRYQVLKNGVPVAVADGPDEAERLYAEYEADEIREVE